MKKFAAVPLVLALSLGAAACSKGEDTTNTAVSNDVTLNSTDEVVTDENASATLDANATDVDTAGANLSDTGVDATGNAGTATTNTL